MILTDIGKFMGQKVAAAIITVAVVAAGIWCWQHPEEVKAFGHVVKVTLLWVVVAGALPWSSFLFIRPLMRFQSDSLSANGAAMLSIAVIAAYWVIDILLALWLADWGIAGTFSWIVVLIGFAAAGVYNFVICESLARYVGE